MNRFLAAISLLALASCGGNVAPVAASLTPAVLPAETVATLRTWCARAQPLIAIAQGAGVVVPQAKAIVDEVGPYCAIMAAGQVPPTTDANTASWLPTNIAGLAAALGLSIPR